MIRIRFAVAIALGALVLGASGTWLAMRMIANRELRCLALAQELEVSGLCANGLKLQASERDGTLVMLLEHRLDSSVAHARELVDEGAHLYPGTPNLIDSVRRAADYYASKQYSDRKQSAEALLARLRNEQ